MNLPQKLAAPLAALSLALSPGCFEAQESGISGHTQAFKERILLVFDDATVPCSFIQSGESPYHSGFHCQGNDFYYKNGEKHAIIPGYGGSLALSADKSYRLSAEDRTKNIELITEIIRCHLVPLGIDVLTEAPDDGLPYNTVFIGGVAGYNRDDVLTMGLAKRDIDNRIHDEFIYVMDSTAANGGYLTLRTVPQIAFTLRHEMGHALGLGHNSDPGSLMFREENEGDLCSAGFNSEEARELTENLKDSLEGPEQVPLDAGRMIHSACTELCRDAR